MNHVWIAVGQTNFVAIDAADRQRDGIGYELAKWVDHHRHKFERRRHVRGDRDWKRHQLLAERKALLRTVNHDSFWYHLNDTDI